MFRLSVEAAHVPGHNPNLDPARQAPASADALAQALQRHELELSDGVAFPVDQGPQAASLNLEPSTGVVVGGLTKPGQAFEPVHRSPRNLHQRASAYADRAGAAAPEGLPHSGYFG